MERQNELCDNKIKKQMAVKILKICPPSFEVSKIIKLRSQHTALRYGDFYTLIADKNVYAYVRSDLNERILVILNKSTRRNNTKIEFPNVYGASKLVSLIDGKELKVKSNKATIKLDAQEFNIYEIKQMN